MRILGKYAFNNGEEFLMANYSSLLPEIFTIIEQIDSKLYKTKISKEKTMPGKLLFNPVEINDAFKAAFDSKGWKPVRIQCVYTREGYVQNHTPPQDIPRNAFREMDFVKEKVGIEIQLGKYAFMVYNVCAKMTIFHNKGKIDCGIEIVPMYELAVEMSSGVSYFEQIVWDLKERGCGDIDIPVLIIGIGP